MEPAVFREIFTWACLAHVLAAVAAFTPIRRTAPWLIALGLSLSIVSCYLRIYAWWPLLALYQAPYFTSMIFAGICLYKHYQNNPERKVFVVALACISLLALLFPKDHYLPFIHSRTWFAHAFMLTGAGARACLFASACVALGWLFSAKDGESTRLAKAAWHKWMVWGFALFTVSMFSGEVWSYLGWGVPIVWEDPAIIAGMVVWFYFALHLHLDLLRFFNTERIAWAVVFGAGITFIFACYPDMGRFDLPTWVP